MEKDFVHPSTRILESTSDKLKGKRIVLGITGSVAAFLSPILARELIRHGSEVIPVMTEASQKMIGKDLIWWATGVEPITKITGNLEHISLAGVMNEPVDLMLIAPSTTNTVAKLASGIADTSVTLIASSLNGKGIPIMVLCVAHIDLINSPSVKNSLEILKKQGLVIVDPILEEGKAKVPDIEDLVLEIMKQLIPNDLEGRDLIVTGGPTREYIDAVRFISNPSSGKTGLELAKEGFIRGANVHLINGAHNLKIPRSIPFTNVVSSEEMFKETSDRIKNSKNPIVILSSAMADFTPVERISEKLKSGKEIQLKLVPTEKLSNQIKKLSPKATFILYKAESAITKEKLIESAITKLKENQANLIIANDISVPEFGFGSDQNKVIIIDDQRNVDELTADKSKIAEVVLSRIIDLL